MNAADLINRELDKGVSRRELARRCGVSLGTIQNILLGDTEIKNSTLKKISDYFKVEIEHDKIEPAIHVAADVPPTTTALLFKALMDRIDAQGNALQAMQSHILKLNETIDEVNRRMYRVAESGDLKFLGRRGVKVK